MLQSAKFSPARVKYLSFLILTLLQFGCKQELSKAEPEESKFLYTTNRTPLKSNPYIELPLGTIKPRGWLKEMLLTQKNGSTADLDKLYPLVMGKRNGWLGGDGDQWERGPYWIKGLLPLAYILDDKELIAKTKPWIEWALLSQDAEGHFGPSKDYSPEPGIQRDNARDWWPKMVMLKVLQQYYAATEDKRVITFMTNYFRYQLKTLPEKPLGHWTFWGTYRGGDNLMVVYWLYNITGDKFLLELADLLHNQTYDFTNMALRSDVISTQQDMHCVNLAQGLKEPIIYYQHHTDSIYSKAFKKALSDIRKYMGQPQGMFGGDEAIRNNDPVNGSELCSAVELMLTLENAIAITGDIEYADHLERIAFNAMPTQISDDFNTRQYFQQANQVMITRHDRNFSVDHQGTDVCYGLLTGYPCCTSNMHMGWPMFTQNLWYATPDKGVASLIFSPSEVKVKVSNDVEAHVIEQTNYPFDEKIKYTFNFNKQGGVTFPFHLRIPKWCKHPDVTINGKSYKQGDDNQILKIEREWKSGDVLELTLPMEVTQTRWHENSVAVERGPLVYALKIGEEWRKVKNDKDPIDYGNVYYEVLPTDPWNYGLVEVPKEKFIEAFTVIKKDSVSTHPWNIQNAPIEIKAPAKRIPRWTLYNESAGPLPYSVTWGNLTTENEEVVSLIPYGCTTLRITEFPLIHK